MTGLSYRPVHIIISPRNTTKAETFGPVFLVVIRGVQISQGNFAYRLSSFEPVALDIDHLTPTVIYPFTTVVSVKGTI